MTQAVREPGVRGRGPAAWVRLAAITRVYSAPYLTLAGVCVAAPAAGALTTRSLLVLLLLPLGLTAGLAALNDLSHRAADLRAGRQRDYPVALLVGTGAGGTLAALGLAAIGGPGVLGGVLGCVLAGVGYGLVKRVAGLANVARGLSTLALLLGLATLQGRGLAALPLACGLALLDAAGNIWGDVRDTAADRRAGLRTLVVRHPRGARALAVALHGLASALLATATPLIWWLWPAGALVWLLPERQTHMGFLGLKYLSVALLGLAVAGEQRALVLALGALAVPALAVYHAIHGRPARAE